MTAATTPSESPNPPANRLAGEKSPYLLQHQHNPVDWYPWGTEALERARTEDRPIFLSVGYSACHWCHVMERESFENEAIAALLNAHFVAVKVDREERPDVDEVYMNAVQMMTGQGGWPMSVFLTPDGRPFYGGTYFPPRDMPGRIGFPNLIAQLADAWANRRAEVEQVATSIAEELRRAARQRPIPASGPLDPEALLTSAVADLAGRFDEDNGGFNPGGPKFPPHHALRMLLTAMERGDPDESSRLALTTLDHMALGGIYDHVGGGFHRYATDAFWLLPHFEKMLYDNALLARLYAQAYSVTGRRAYARVARETCDWVLRDMQDPAGGFHAALDADSEGEEGKYYVWTADEVKATLGPDASPAFCERYNILDGGNWREEATGHRNGTNIPHLAVGPAAGTNVLLPDTLAPEMRAALDTLRAVRDRRVPPGKDDKVITAWNGLMIGALAFAGHILGEDRYRDAARRAADFCLTVLRPGGELRRRYARGEAALPAYLDDYAFLADGLLDLYDATGEERWLFEARSLADVLLDRFWDTEDGGFFFAGRGQEELIALSKELFDGALPSANGVAVRVLTRLGALPDGERYAEKAREMLTTFRGLMEHAPSGTQTLILASLDAVTTPPTAAEPISLAPAVPGPLPLARGERAEIAFVLRLAPGHHVNANLPAQDYLIPTTATIASDLPAAVGPVVYPAPIPYEAGGATLAVYKDSARLTVPVVLAADAAPGTYHLTLTVHAQACRETECLPPIETAVSLSVEVR